MSELSNAHIIEYNIVDTRHLYASYLPFVKNGAIFIPSDIKVNLGDVKTASITLPGSVEKQIITGSVVWINHHSQANRPSGFAIKLSSDESGQAFKNTIERLLVGMSDSPQATYTM